MKSSSVEFSNPLPLCFLEIYSRSADDSLKSFGQAMLASWTFLRQFRTKVTVDIRGLRQFVEMQDHMVVHWHRDLLFGFSLFVNEGWIPYRFNEKTVFQVSWESAQLIPGYPLLRKGSRSALLSGSSWRPNVFA